MRSLEGLKKEEKEGVKCKNEDEIGHGEETIEEGRDDANYEF